MSGGRKWEPVAATSHLVLPVPSLAGSCVGFPPVRALAALCWSVMQPVLGVVFKVDRPRAFGQNYLPGMDSLQEDDLDSNESSAEPTPESLHVSGH
jgi:hypothetical protein